MRAVVQRSGPAKCQVDGKITGQINAGLVVFISVDPEDTLDDVEWMGNKIAGLRIFSDEDGKMNLSLLDLVNEKEEGSEIGVLSISQFTLHGNARKGFRPSFVGAAPPEKALEFYTSFNDDLRNRGLIVEEGIFGATMDISLVNEGPVTILIDSKHKF
ncbi:MAG: D-aminoacyl-tRNA deacylase [bacterium]|nr:D-aminoacyl-tRNA deacylase [bacterium]